MFEKFAEDVMVRYQQKLAALAKMAEEEASEKEHFSSNDDVSVLDYLGNKGKMSESVHPNDHAVPKDFRKYTDKDIDQLAFERNIAGPLLGPADFTPEGAPNKMRGASKLPLSFIGSAQSGLTSIGENALLAASGGTPDVRGLLNYTIPETMGDDEPALVDQSIMGTPNLYRFGTEVLDLPVTEFGEPPTEDEVKALDIDNRVNKKYQVKFPDGTILSNINPPELNRRSIEQILRDLYKK